MRITAAEIAAAHDWAQTALTAAAPPFSFTYDGRPSAELLPGWNCAEASRSLDDQRTERTLTWTDPATGLQVRCVSVTYRDWPAVEWTVYLTNTGAADTPILEDIQGLDAHFTRPEGGEFLLHYHRGDWCHADGYEPHTQLMTPHGRWHFAPDGGRASDRAFPYYNLQYPGGGVFLAVGWPAQWASDFHRDGENGVTLRAGQELTHLKLLPGEEIRTPLIALVFWSGEDRLRAQNVWRRWFIAQNLPRPGGELPPPLMAAGSNGQLHEMQEATEENQFFFMDRYLDAGVALDVWWMDAGWYPFTTGWWDTGTWEVDTARFPRGLRAVSDHAHQRGVKTLLWFEPERVTTGSWLHQHHPEWLLHTDSPDNHLLDLGNPEALAWLIDHTDSILVEQGIDLYRQDFNFAPLPYWRGHDAADRQGIAENHHTAGYLAYWDALRARHPEMLLDSCASGGRRNDLETMRRGVPLHKTDYNYSDLPVKQAFHHTLFSWLPYFAAPMVPAEQVDPYAFHSAFCLFLATGYEVRRDDLDWPLHQALTDKWRELAPFLYGDYYPLTPFHRDEEYWMVWQFNRPEQGDGMVQAFRRVHCAAPTVTLALHDLEPEATYRIADWDGQEIARFSGRELMDSGLPITLPQARSAVILLYTRV